MKLSHQRHVVKMAAAIVLAWFLSTTGKAAPTSANVQMKLEQVQSTKPGNESVLLAVVLTNVSHETLSFAEPAQFSFFNVSASQEGHPLPALISRPSIEMGLVNVHDYKPGQSRRFVINLSTWFDFSASDTAAIKAVFFVEYGADVIDGKVVIKSTEQCSEEITVRTVKSKDR